MNTLGESELSSIIANVIRKRYWELPREEALALAISVNPYVATSFGNGLPESEVERIVTNYHFDHIVVQALSDPENKQHEQAWQEMRLFVYRLVLSLLRSEDDFLIEDIVQQSLLDLYLGIDKFRYGSRLMTYVYTVAKNSIVRYYRSTRSLKRSSFADLDLGEALIVPTEKEDDSPSQVAQDHVLYEIAIEILRAQSDKRLTEIFALWVQGERLMGIAERLKLSVGRVHFLLRQAITILRDHPNIKQWVGLDDAYQDSNVSKQP